MSPRFLHRFFPRALSFELGLGAVALIAAWLLGLDPWRASSSALPGREPMPWGLQVAWGCGATVPLLLGLWLLDHYPVGPLRELKQLSTDLLNQLFAPLPLWQLFVLSAGAGLGEELLFRGVLQGGLERFLPGAGQPLVAWLLASVLFGLCHWLSATYACLAAMVGGYLGGLYLVTGGLAAPILTHGLYDFIALVYITRDRPRSGPPGAGGGTT